MTDTNTLKQLLFFGFEADGIFEPSRDKLPLPTHTSTIKGFSHMASGPSVFGCSSVCECVLVLNESCGVWKFFFQINIHI